MEEEIEEKAEENPRSELNIQNFMIDMDLLRDQVRGKEIVKSNFEYGSLEVTNYILWLCLGELISLNDKLNEDEE